MFIAYDTKEKQIGTYEPYGVRCTTCSSSNAIVYDVHQKYFRLFWIPFIPLKKIVYKRCTSCGRKFLANSFKEFDTNIKEAKLQVKTKWYFFIGAILLASLLVLLANSIIKDNRDTKKFMTSPQVNDIYEFFDKATANGYYARVYKVTSDSIFFYESNIAFRSYKMKNRPNYNNDTIYSNQKIALPKSILTEMYEANEIRKVMREKEL